MSLEDRLRRRGRGLPRHARMPTTPRANELARQFIEEGSWRPQRIDLPAVAGGARTWVGFGRGTLDDFIAMALVGGAPVPTQVVVRGIEGVRLGDVVALPWRDGVLIGPLAAVTQRIDSQATEARDEDVDQS